MQAVQNLPVVIGVQPDDTFVVGEFFWIADDAIIGWDRDARHGNGDDESSGSVDVGCVLTVRGIEDGYAIVRLDRPEMPFGALASIGTVFKISIGKMLSWDAKLKHIKDAEIARKALASKYCK